ncbi:MAG: trimethylamine corrinoid protein 2 [Proteobacteria bacterium]|nr:trimethylamine corrinoid protein 2 [Pseudomonadota bacterium]
MEIPMEEKKRKFVDWWNQKGVVVGGWTGAFKDRSIDLDTIIGSKAYWEGSVNKYLNPGEAAPMEPFILDMQEFPAETLRAGSIVIGPGSLALYLGSEPLASEHTIWFTKAYDTRDQFPDTLTFDPDNVWWQRTERAIDESLKVADGNYLIGLPDLVENLDILASLRGTNEVLLDLYDAPEWVEAKIREINQVFFEVYDRMYERLKGEAGDSIFSAYSLWAPGKVAKLQCDISANISPQMFERFVLPSLVEQVEFLDYSVYHLDGTTCLQHLDHLLSIEGLTAIEWTPQTGIETGTDPRWYPLYHQILDAGKSLQVLVSKPEEVETLLKEIGTDGIYLLNQGKTTDVYEIAETVEKVR